MAADIIQTVRTCQHCAKNRIRLIKRSNPMKLFPATEPLESVAMDLLGPLPKTKKGNQYILVITDRFTKLTQIVPLRTITAEAVAAAFVIHWVFKYGTPKQTLTDNGSQFASKFMQETCQVLGVSNTFTSTYHPQTNGQAERFNRTLTAMLRCYVDENPTTWDVYAAALTYAYNTSVHKTTGTTPFDLVLSRPPPSFATNLNQSRVHSQDTQSFAERLRISIDKARSSLAKTQARYKKDFDKRVRRVANKPKVNGYVYLDPQDGTRKRSKLQHDVEGPYKVLEVNDRTIVIQRGDVVERVSADRTTPAPTPPQPKIANVHDASPKDLLQKNIEGETWLVESILEHRKNKHNQYEFRVDWVGDYEPTWEPRSNIPEELVSRYFAHAAKLSKSAQQRNAKKSSSKRKPPRSPHTRGANIIAFIDEKTRQVIQYVDMVKSNTIA